MLGLKLPTDPRWVKLVHSNIPEILTDHAYCEQKAASNAISILVLNPELPDLVSTLTDIAIEEMTHFKMVHEIILKRGYTMGRERKDDYVNELYKFVRSGFQRHIVLVDRLLFAAMIEARSCERFKMLSENIKDEELAKFYYDLMASEAQHYTTFIKLAHKYNGGEDVDKRWKEFLEYEAMIIQKYGVKETMHG